MTSLATLAPTTVIPDRPPPADVRLSVRVPASAGDFIDGGWWPRSRDLTVELPALLRALWASGTNLTHVAYSMLFWAAAPRQMRIDGRRVRLGGFPHQDQRLLRLNDAWQRERVDLLVIAPDTAPALAERALRIAGHSDNRLRANEVLPAAAAEADHPYRLGCVDPLADAGRETDGAHTGN